MELTDLCSWTLSARINERQRSHPKSEQLKRRTMQVFVYVESGTRQLNQKLFEMSIVGQPEFLLAAKEMWRFGQNTNEA